MYYIYKERQSEEKSVLNTKDTKKFDYKKFRHADDYESQFEEEEKELSNKKPDKKESPKKPTKVDANEFNELINKEKTDINSELFKKHFSFQRPSEAEYSANNGRKSEKLVNVIESGLSHLKNEIKEIYDDETEIEKPDKIIR